VILQRKTPFSNKKGNIHKKESMSKTPFSKTAILNKTVKTVNPGSHRKF